MINIRKHERKLHWTAHIGAAVLVVVLVLTHLVAFGVGVEVTKHFDHGQTAGRPGVPSVASHPITGGLGGASNPSFLAKGEGKGAAWCAEHNGYALGSAVDGVYACGPATGSATPFDTVGFQCVEVSVRFIWAKYGLYVQNVPSGSELVAVAHAELNIPVGIPGYRVYPMPGDVLSLNRPGADPNGHTAIVIADHIDKAGNGTVSIMEQNGTVNGIDYLNVQNWREWYGDPNYNGGYYYYSEVSWLELGKRTQPFQAKAWNHFAKAHHKKLISYYRPHSHSLTLIASTWLRHVSECWSARDRQSWVQKRRRRHGYMRQDFSQCTIYVWPHERTWKPRIRRR